MAMKKKDRWKNNLPRRRPKMGDIVRRGDGYAIIKPLFDGATSMRIEALDTKTGQADPEALVAWMDRANIVARPSDGYQLVSASVFEESSAPKWLVKRAFFVDGQCRWVEVPKPLAQALEPEADAVRAEDLHDDVVALNVSLEATERAQVAFIDLARQLGMMVYCIRADKRPPGLNKDRLLATPQGLFRFVRDRNVRYWEKIADDTPVLPDITTLPNTKEETDMTSIPADATVTWPDGEVQAATTLTVGELALLGTLRSGDGQTYYNCSYDDLRLRAAWARSPAFKKWHRTVHTQLQQGGRTYSVAETTRMRDAIRLVYEKGLDLQEAVDILEKQRNDEPQQETDMTEETNSKFKQGIAQTFNATKVATFEAAATATVAVANKELVEQVASIVEERSPELAAFLRTDLGRPVALYIAATVLHGASTTELLPFQQEFVQKYAQRTQFGATFEASMQLGEGLLDTLKMTVFGHMSDVADKLEKLKQRHGIVPTVFDSVEEVEADEVVLADAVEVNNGH